MKILHSSDWHLGQSLMGKSREEEHRAFLEWLLRRIGEERPDLLIVAGDIYDSGTPPNYAQRLYHDFLARVREAGCPRTVIVGGNHDSVANLEKTRDLLEHLGVTVVSGGEEEPVVLPVRREGELLGALCAVPFLRDSILRRRYGDGGTLAERIDAFYAEAHGRALELLEGRALPIVATGHLTLCGGKMGETEREIYIGQLEGIDGSLLAKRFDYVALGHLHRAQRAGAEHLRYSGTPLPIDFSEADQPKSITRVTFGPERRIEEIPLPTFRRLHRCRGSLAEVLEAMEAIGEKEAWVEVNLLSDRIHEAMRQIHERAQELSLSVLAVKRLLPPRSEQPGEEPESATLDELTPQEVFRRRLALEGIAEEGLEEALEARFRTILGELIQKEEA